jgi:hypothetical protein
LNPAAYRRHRDWRRWSFTTGRAQGNGDTPDGRLFGVKALVLDHRDVSDASNANRLEEVATSLSAMGGVAGEAYRKAVVFIARTLAPELFTAGAGASESEATIAARATTTFAATELSLDRYEETVAKLDEDQLAALDQLIAAQALAVEDIRRSIADVIRSMRRAPQLALTYQALVRPEDADDEHHFGAVFDVGLASRLSATFNGTLVRTHRKVLEDMSAVRIAGQMQFDLQQVAGLQDLIRRNSRDPMTISLAGMGEWHSNDVPDIAKLQVKLTIPMPGVLAGLKIPLSVTFANRTELIDEKEIRGNVGFTLDLSKLQNSLGALRR